MFALDGDRVLRRSRTRGSNEAEARLMTYLRERGYPVPEVLDADDTDLVMQRLHGPTMAADLMARPLRWRHHMGVLADLHRRLHAIAAPTWLRPFDETRSTAFERTGPGAGPAEGRPLSTLHLDLHPMNVIPHPDRRNGIRRPLVPILRHVMLRHLRSAWCPGTPDALPRAAAYRYRDHNLSPEEIDRLRRHIARRRLGGRRRDGDGRFLIRRAVRATSAPLVASSRYVDDRRTSWVSSRSCERRTSPRSIAAR